MQKFLLATTFFFAVAGSAMAADPVVYEPAPEVPVFTWTGAYIGVHAGYAWTSGDFSHPDFGSASRDLDGGLLGVYAGYNWQFSPNFVGGIEFDIEHLWADDDFDFVAGVPVSHERDWQGSARLRAGYAMDRTLLYVTGGVAFATARVEAFNPAPPPIVNVDEEKTHWGWTIGAGVEHAFTDNWIGRLEYRFTDFSSEDFDNFDVEHEQNAIRVGIAYKF